MIFIVAAKALPSEFHLDQVAEELAYVWELKEDVGRCAVREVLLLRESEEKFHYGDLFLLNPGEDALFLVLF